LGGLGYSGLDSRIRGRRRIDFDSVARIRAAYDSASVSRTLAPDDHMWNTGPDWYWTVGESGLDAVLHALSLAPTPRVSRILDLPCGHGRVARHLRRAFPDAEMVYCDLDSAAVEFCAKTFEGRGIVSRPELTEVELPGEFDVIWMGSLFTHVDEPRTKRWLAYLARHLSQVGVLVATFHGMWAIEVQTRVPMIDPYAWEVILREYRARGYGYASYADFDLGDYGISLATPSRLLAIATSTPGVRIIMYQERGWADNHDVLALTREPRTRPS
jgi:SAM-dependent methyltransferase